MKPNDVTFDSYAEYNEGSNEKDPKFTVGDCVRIPKYKDIFAKGYTQNWPEEALIIRKIQNSVPSTYVISDMDICYCYYVQELQKKIKKNSE